MCDNCLRQLKVNRQDVSAAAAAVLDTLQSLPAADKRLTLTQLTGAWRKSQVLPLPHSICPHQHAVPIALPACSAFSFCATSLDNSNSLTLFGDGLLNLSHDDSQGSLLIER